PLAKPRRAAAGSPVMRKERASSPIIVRISRNEARLHDFLEDLWRDVERLCDELAGRKDGIDVVGERQVLIEGLRESIDKYLEDFNKGGFKKIAEYAKDKLEQAINDIERDREPNAHWRLIGVISKVVEAYGGLFKERLERRKRWFRDNKVRVWRRKGNVRMAHGIYEIPEGADRPMLGEGESTFDSAWEMFRGIDKEIDNELKEKQVLTEAEAALYKLISFLKSKKQNNEGYVLDADDIEKIKGDFGRVEELMGGFQRRYRADPKKIAQGLLGVVKKIILSGFRHVGTVDSFLDAAVYYLQLRISSLDLIVSRIKEAKLKDARLLVEQRNKDLSGKIKIIISLIKANELDRAAKYIMGMRNRYDIKNEPDLGYLQGILSRAKKSLDGKNRPDALFDMQMIKEAVFWSDFIRGTIAQFRDELIEIELKEKRILGGQEQYQLLLRVLLSTIKLTGPPQRQAKQLFRAWARVYQAAFIPLNIDNPLKKSQRIPNPAFEAATKYIYILDITKIGILLSKTRQLNKGNFAATRAFLEEVRNKAKRDYLMRLDLPGLVEAIAKDKELSLEQQEALNKCIYPESAISSPASSPLAKPRRAAAGSPLKRKSNETEEAQALRIKLGKLSAFKDKISIILAGMVVVAFIGGMAAVFVNLCVLQWKGYPVNEQIKDMVFSGWLIATTVSFFIFIITDDILEKREKRLSNELWHKLSENEKQCEFEEEFTRRCYNYWRRADNPKDISKEEIWEAFEKFGLSPDQNICEEEFKRIARRIIKKNHVDRYMGTDKESYYNKKTYELMAAYNIILKWYKDNADCSSSPPLKKPASSPLRKEKSVSEKEAARLLMQPEKIANRGTQYLIPPEPAS
ncbi:MAG: hypothetical protein WA066_02385, partial [Candidatus Omnitrophota bacterium]